MKTYLMHLNKWINEKELLEYLEKILKERISSSGFKRVDADNYLQYLEYDDDFRIVINLICGESSNINFEDYELAKNIALYFKTGVLFETTLSNENKNWCYVDSEAKASYVEVFETESGFSIKNKDEK
jgi:hypothetical protein